MAKTTSCANCIRHGALGRNGTVILRTYTTSRRCHDCVIRIVYTRNNYTHTRLGTLKESHDPKILYRSRPAAGFPVPGDDAVEQILDINDLVVKNPSATFFVRVESDSMKHAGIFSDDVLVIDRSVQPTHGCIVVAAVYGEMVVKRLALTDNTLTLVSENPDYAPIVVSDSEDCHIWGVVVGSIRVF
ncbi:MAG: translesion error-prone DNA polymerase V autoproteolytic subunit [Candidatus Pacebacteria bacterium]|nr:translesion error-prone DNA polymerase V autoproteolytic subunit [Candidatus Paceibacterota bacterium]